ncbi:hypothetical protein TGDOM2_401610, partial [Toxoplasma gondii GAB2-2007-GAL-DOM2]
MYHNRKAAKEQKILERKAMLTGISRDIRDLKSKMRSILNKAPDLRPLVNTRSYRWRHKETGNIPDVGSPGMLATTGTSSATLPETREELEKLISQQMRLVRSLLGLASQRRRRLRKMVQNTERRRQENSSRDSEKSIEEYQIQEAEIQAAEWAQRELEAEVRDAEERHTAAQNVVKIYRQKLREMKQSTEKRRHRLRGAKRSSLMASPSGATEAQSTSGADVSDAGGGGSKAGSTSLPGDVRPAPQRGASEGRRPSGTSAATSTSREPLQHHSGRRKRKGQGEREVPLTGIPLTGNGTRCHPGRATVDGARFSDVMSEKMCRSETKHEFS